MIPFMLAVCLSLLSALSECERHQKCLTDIVDSWGFRLHPVLGDGNCCFSALAFTIHAQQEDIELRLPQLFVDLSIEINAYQLRRIAVDEWMNNVDEYQHFLDGEHMVREEAPMFLQQGHFFGPLGNTMVACCY